MILAKFRDWVVRERLGLGLVIAAWAVFFGAVFASGNIFFLDDLKIIYYPLEHAYAQAQANWDLPLWSNEFGFGHPLLAWGQLGFFTPLHVLLRFVGLHPLALLQVSIASYFLAGLIGTYLFLRQRLFTALPSALGAGIFVFSGFAIGHLNHVNFYTGTMLLPYLLLAGLAIIARPTVRRAAVLALIAAAIALSAQPQVVVFTFAAAGVLLLGIALERQYRSRWRAIVVAVVAAGVLGAGMASLAILPLLEFIPETERAAPLPRLELLEFSYPPWHAITLILPYFYGGHDSYWGAKGFQELAAFTGLIPLLLAGVALASWKHHRPERIVGSIFVVGAIAFALGRYSPLYAYLIEEQYITSLGVAGRFVFFFDIGVLLLAASGLSDLMRVTTRTHLAKYLTVGTLFVLFLLAPAFLRILQSGPEQQQLASLWQQWDAFLLIVVLTVPAIPLLVLSRWRWRHHTLMGLAIATLVAYSWNYNPVTPIEIATAQSPLTTELRSYGSVDGTGPRLYSRPALIQSTATELDIARYSDPIGPTFSVFQPIPADKPFTCVALPLEAAGVATADVAVGWHHDPLQPPVEAVVIPPHEVGQGSARQTCFATLSQQKTDVIWISLTSQSDSGTSVAFVPQTNTAFQVRFVRTVNPTAEEWERSQKPLQALITPVYETAFDEEAAARARHMQVLDGASSARWIGALSIREYRAFIEFFFANDTSPFDADGLHVIERYRSILDMVGVTHLAGLLPAGGVDNMEAQGFGLADTADLGDSALRVYRNPDAYPRAFLVPGAIWKSAADETRHGMSLPGFNPRHAVYLSGPKPPDSVIEPPGTPAASYTATIERYEPTRVDVRVVASEPGYLVLTDSTTPQWHTYLDDEPALQLVGNSIFKTAAVPAGEHVVSFRYVSPATNQAVRIASGALVLALGGLLYPIRRPSRQ